ncbi:hypothetical protein QBC41DRAFT_360233 [Cercophora samala]|uniref:Uncharacterized protein n=1 Tax=Cercophora samala TaxID=330535 RepID=A0AA39YXU5_9PEZI|nr:hypothetical protein QBC41DRAFT_360233 [Cercophora samala]
MSKLISPLRGLGYEVHCPRMTSVVIMHSYGGKVGTNALHSLSREARSQKGLKGGIIQLIYVCAFAPAEGQSMAALIAESGHEELMPVVFHIEENGGPRFRDTKGPLIGDDLGESEEEECKMTGPAACKENPVAYVYCTKDSMVPLGTYEKLLVASIEKDGREVKTVFFFWRLVTVPT